MLLRLGDDCYVTADPSRNALELRISVELRGFEPGAEPAETAPDLRWLCVHVVTQVLSVLLICLGVLRNVTSLDGYERFNFAPVWQEQRGHDGLPGTAGCVVGFGRQRDAIEAGCRNRGVPGGDISAESVRPSARCSRMPVTRPRKVRKKVLEIVPKSGGCCSFLVERPAWGRNHTQGKTR